MDALAKKAVLQYESTVPFAFKFKLKILQSEKHFDRIFLYVCADYAELSCDVGSSGTYVGFTRHVVKVDPIAIFAGNDSLGTEDHTEFATVEFFERGTDRSFREGFGCFKPDAVEDFVCMMMTFVIVIMVMATAGAVRTVVVVMLVLIMFVVMVVMMVLVFMIMVMLVIFVMLVVMFVIVVVMVLVLVLIIVVVMVMRMLLSFKKSSGHI